MPFRSFAGAATGHGARILIHPANGDNPSKQPASMDATIKGLPRNTVNTTFVNERDNHEAEAHMDARPPRSRAEARA